MNGKPRILITMGDPGGIGPEILDTILFDKDVLKLGNITLIGPKRALKTSPKDVELIDVDLEGLSFHHRPHPDNGRIALLAIEEAVRRMENNSADLLVTGPVSKEAIRRCGVPFQGHTEYFGHHYNVTPYMVFFANHSKIALFTRHLPLMEVSTELNKEKLVSWVEGLDKALSAQLQIAPVYKIMGLNPHAGEGGLIGREEVDVLFPAIEELNSKGIKTEGPFPSDSLFVYESKEECVVIALYHDQGMIPAKLISKGHAVNFTFGIPFLRTSPDHGPAFDVVGKGAADPESFKRAIAEGVKLLRKK
jgi:4-hydroxythreonine-4-phosphate dehydrogenase